MLCLMGLRELVRICLIGNFLLCLLFRLLDTLCGNWLVVFLVGLLLIVVFVGFVVVFERKFVSRVAKDGLICYFIRNYEKLHFLQCLLNFLFYFKQY
jgi:hypothetical protein